MSFLSLKKISFFLFIVITQLGLRSQAQTIPMEYPKIGDTCPAFIMKDLHYYSKKQAKSSDFIGRPLILDFFSVGCKACFESFPHLNALKKEFEGKVQFLLIAKRSPGLQKQYENYMKHYSLDLPVDYDDSTIWNEFGVSAVPYTLWIDNLGIIRQITNYLALTPDRINNLLKGKSQPLSVSINKQDTGTMENFYGNFYDYKKPLLIGGKGGSDTSFLYRSILCKWDYRTYVSRDLYISPSNKNQLQEVCAGLNALFNLAYGDTVSFLVPRTIGENTDLQNHYGQWATFPLVESSKKSLFNADMDSSNNLFSYSLTIPDSDASARKLQGIMKRDLKNYFSMDATVETRSMPCWKITAEKNAEKILRTKGGQSQWIESFSGFTFQNQPMSSVLIEIWSYIQREPVIIDETGINYNIDIKLDAVMTDIHDIQKALQKNGLDLIMGEKQMKVIVVRDLKE
jgi:thiol-disulfide isomerase/thioredoxin